MLESIVNIYSIGAVFTMNNSGNLDKNNRNQPSIPQNTDTLSPNSAFELVKSKIFEMYKIHSNNKHKNDK